MRATGILDMLCWDVKSKKADMPIYQLLGGHNRVVPAYASTVTWPTMDEYERYIKMSRDVGFKAFKLHAWGDVKRDIGQISFGLRTKPEAHCALRLAAAESSLAPIRAKASSPSTAVPLSTPASQCRPISSMA